jgi:hypothetical protein
VRKEGELSGISVCGASVNSATSRIVWHLCQLVRCDLLQVAEVTLISSHASVHSRYVHCKLHNSYTSTARALA